MSYGQSNENPYQQGPAQEANSGGYGGYGQPNPYAQEAQTPNQYEMQDYNNYQQQPAAALSQQDFLNRVQALRDQIKTLTLRVNEIDHLHKATLSRPSEPGHADRADGPEQQLAALVQETQLNNTAIKDGIKGLERDLAKTTDTSRNTKTTQLQSLKTFFKSELDKYQSIERENQQKYREQIARQYRIVNPDASEADIEEITAADWGTEGVFQTALRTNRTGLANSVLGNVRARHNELQRIEQTLSELAVLYQELATVVEQQEPIIQAAEYNAQNTVENIEKGNEQVSQANKHARNRRKLKWWCLLVCVLIVIAIAVGVGVGVGIAKN